LFWILSFETNTKYVSKLYKISQTSSCGQIRKEKHYNTSHIISGHSEGARQQLETLRSGTRHRAAVLIQATWRGWRLRRRWPALRRSLELQQQAAVSATGTLAGVANTSVAVVSVQQARAAAAATATGTGTGAATAGASSTRPRPQPIAGTPPPDPAEKCDHKMIQQTCTLFGLDLVRMIQHSRSFNNEKQEWKSVCECNKYIQIHSLLFCISD